MLQALTHDPAVTHTRKPHNSKRTRADGVLLRKRDGQAAYIEYALPFALTYLPSIDGGREQIQCRVGDSCFTLEGRHLWPHVEDLQAKLTELLQEADDPAHAVPGVPSIETLTIRLWV